MCTHKMNRARTLIRTHAHPRAHTEEAERKINHHRYTNVGIHARLPSRFIAFTPDRATTATAFMQAIIVIKQYINAVFNIYNIRIIYV